MVRLVNLKCFLGQEIAVSRFGQEAFPVQLDGSWELSSELAPTPSTGVLSVLPFVLAHWLYCWVWCAPPELSSIIARHVAGRPPVSSRTSSAPQQYLGLPALSAMDLVLLLPWNLFESCMFCHNFLNVSTLLTVTLQGSVTSSSYLVDYLFIWKRVWLYCHGLPGIVCVDQVCLLLPLHLGIKSI